MVKLRASPSEAPARPQVPDTPSSPVVGSSQHPWAHCPRGAPSAHLQAIRVIRGGDGEVGELGAGSVGALIEDQLSPPILGRQQGQGGTGRGGQGMAGTKRMGGGGGRGRQAAGGGAGPGAVRARQAGPSPQTFAPQARAPPTRGLITAPAPHLPVCGAA